MKISISTAWTEVTPKISSFRMVGRNRLPDNFTFIGQPSCPAEDRAFAGNAARSPRHHRKRRCHRVRMQRCPRAEARSGRYRLREAAPELSADCERGPAEANRKPL